MRALVTTCLWSSCSAAAALSAFTTARGELPGRVVSASPVEPSSLFERLNWPRLKAPEAAQLTPVVRLPGFLSEDDMEQIHALASAVRASSGDDCLSTATKGAQLAEGAWQTIFLNKRLPQLLPALWSRTLQAMSNADAEHFHVLDTARRTLNLRSAEYHEIAPTGSLPHPKHLDYGSLITVDFMLSGTDEFEGGAFSTLEADGQPAMRESTWPLLSSPSPPLPFTRPPGVWTPSRLDSVTSDTLFLGRVCALAQAISSLTPLSAATPSSSSLTSTTASLPSPPADATSSSRSSGRGWREHARRYEIAISRSLWPTMREPIHPERSWARFARISHAQRCSDPFGPCYCKYAPRQCALVDGGERSAYEPPWVRVRREDTADSPHFVRSQPR